jgi:peptidoglycan/LPS O-acetylase OafA/YrhL
LDGVRALTMLWILIGHRYNDDINTWISNYEEAKLMYKKPLAMPIVNSYLAVDTFFLLSGTLSYLTCTKALENGTFSMIRYLIYRYLRLSLPYAMVIFYYATVLLHTGTGPLWSDEATGSSNVSNKITI